MTEKCSKCLTEDTYFTKYAYVTENPLQMNHISLCRICDNAYDQNLLLEFLKEDFGTFPISEVMRNMINARRARALGNGAWQNG